MVTYGDGYYYPHPKSSLSHHFRVLRESGLVATRREGTVIMNTLRREDLDARFPKLLDAMLSSKARRKIAASLQTR